MVPGLKEHESANTRDALDLIFCIEKRNYSPQNAILYLQKIDLDDLKKKSPDTYAKLGSVFKEQIGLDLEDASKMKKIIIDVGLAKFKTTAQTQLFFSNFDAVGGTLLNSLEKIESLTYGFLSRKGYSDAQISAIFEKLPDGTELVLSNTKDIEKDLSKFVKEYSKNVPKELREDTERILGDMGSQIKAAYASYDAGRAKIKSAKSVDEINNVLAGAALRTGMANSELIRNTFLISTHIAMAQALNQNAVAVEELDRKKEQEKRQSDKPSEAEKEITKSQISDVLVSNVVTDLIANKALSQLIIVYSEMQFAPEPDTQPKSGGSSAAPMALSARAEELLKTPGGEKMLAARMNAMQASQATLTYIADPSPRNEARLTASLEKSGVKEPGEAMADIKQLAVDTKDYVLLFRRAFSAGAELKEKDESRFNDMPETMSDRVSGLENKYGLDFSFAPSYRAAAQAIAPLQQMALQLTGDYLEKNNFELPDMSTGEVKALLSTLSASLYTRFAASYVEIITSQAKRQQR